MAIGWTKAWRKELDSSLWDMPPIYHRTFTWLRQKVVFTDVTLNNGIKVRPGQWYTTFNNVAKGISWVERGVEKIPNRKTISGILQWLEEQGMIECESNRNGTMITLVNWHVYQEPDTRQSNIDGATEGASNGTTGRAQNKKVEKGLKKEPKPLPPEAYRLSEQLAEMILHANPGNASLLPTKKDKTIASWAEHIDKAMRIDKRTEKQISDLITWVGNDSFWSSTLQSGFKLREKFDQISMKIQQRNPTAKASTEPAKKLSPELAQAADEVF